MLKRHLMTEHGLTPEEYRARWGLKSDYPMVAATYSAQRQDLAKRFGLGRKPAPEPKPRRRRKAEA
jgi:predicted transcriptional regulator